MNSMQFKWSNSTFPCSNWLKLKNKQATCSYIHQMATMSFRIQNICDQDINATIVGRQKLLLPKGSADNVVKIKKGVCTYTNYYNVLLIFSLASRIYLLLCSDFRAATFDNHIFHVKLIHTKFNIANICQIYHAIFDLFLHPLLAPSWHNNYFTFSLVQFENQIESSMSQFVNVTLALCVNTAESIDCLHSKALQRGMVHSCTLV